MSPEMSPENVIRRAVCPGSFDPVTNGHLDIIGRAAQLYDEVTVAVFVNQAKSSLFSVDERRELLEEVTAQYGNVRIDSFHGLVVDYCRANGIAVIVKGLRAVSDFDYELQMAQMNRGLAGIDTLFMPTNPEYSFLASSLVKEIAKWGGDVSSLVPPNVLKRLIDRTSAS
jgi:pantetheine-phosphate adenylyltransferase